MSRSDVYGYDLGRSPDPHNPRVVHLKHDPYDVRIDRQTHWGNPFVIGKDGTREEVIAKYRDWILSEPDIVAMVKRELRGKTLGCWCAPKACHGDVLLELANAPESLCSDCPPVGYQTDKTRCLPCPRRPSVHSAPEPQWPVDTQPDCGGLGYLDGEQSDKTVGEKP